MLEGVSVPSLIRMVLGGFLVILCRYLSFSVFADSVMWVALLANTTIKCKKRCHGSLRIFSSKIGSGRVQQLSKMRH